MTFSKHAWGKTQPILKEIYQHPFITELILGKLEKHRFIFYLQQDWLYLNDFSKALTNTSLLAPSNHEAAHLIRFSHDVNLVEQELHLTFLRSYNISKKATISPACFHYTNHLKAIIANGDYAKSLAALLPCFWVYQHVGQYILNLSIPNNPYSEWINTYASQEFADSVNTMIEMTDQALADKNLIERKEATRIFKTSTVLELQFWDDAYHKLEYSVQSKKELST